MVGFSFGLKKAAANSKAAPAKLKKPATFGGHDDDDTTASGDGQPKPIAAVEITELDGFDDSTSAPVTVDEDDRKTKKKSKGLPQPPPPVSASSTKKAPPSAAATQFGDLSSALESRKYAEAAATADPSIYDYDAVYDSFKVPSKKEKEADNKEKRPRYFDALQKAAETRERDRAIAEEKRLKREREAEGDEFADKEKFVTEAYKRQQEENRRLEEEEKKREEEEAKKNKNKGLTDFYKQMLEKEEQEHAAKMKAAEERAKVGPEATAPKDESEGNEEKSAAERAKEINAMGGNVIINDDGEVVDKRQLLKGGLNVAPKKKVEHQQEKARQAAKPAAATGQSKGVFYGGSKQAMRERQTRMLEAQLEERLKRAREEEEEERKKVELVSKSRKTEADISSAKERYLARKRAAEEAKKKGEDAAP